MSKTYLVTGGTGFIGAALVRRLLQEGHRVKSLDNNIRGNPRRLRDLINEIELIEGDIRDSELVTKSCKNVDAVCHLAFINGTEFFYSNPQLVLEVGVKGIINVLDGCKNAGVGEFMLMSSSEVYQSAQVVPTDETVPLTIPDIYNPRYSYAGGKIISEILAINYGRIDFDRVSIVRPHNVYGPDMGWAHVLPQFILRLHKLTQTANERLIDFPIQSSGDETRSFVYIDDFIEGTMAVIERGEHLGLYHIGTMQEIAIKEVARMIAHYFGCKLKIRPGSKAKGSPTRRCPDITNVSNLGFEPRWGLAEGISVISKWYTTHAHEQPKNELFESGIVGT